MVEKTPNRLRYMMRKEEWDFWTSDTTLAQPEYEWMTPFVNRQLLPLSNRIELLEQDTEIVPGLQTLFAPGHTPGHMALAIASGGEKLICVGDLISQAWAMYTHNKGPGSGSQDKKGDCLKWDDYYSPSH